MLVVLVAWRSLELDWVESMKGRIPLYLWILTALEGGTVLGD